MATRSEIEARAIAQGQDVYAGALFVRRAWNHKQERYRAH